MAGSRRRLDHPPPRDAEAGGIARSAEAAGAWRLCDAAANRAAEALRVLEDVVRFVLDDGHLTAVAKTLRHDLAAILAGPALAPRIALRDAPGDVGAGCVAAGALGRRDASDLVAANAARAAQALRSLEEVSRVVAPAEAAGFEGLRYRLYALEKAAAGTARAAGRLRGVNLCVLVDGGASAAEFERLVEGLFEAGVRMIQVRDKGLGVPRLVDRARRAVAAARRRAPAEAVVIVNDRADVAAAVGASGVHVGAEDLPVISARRVVGAEAVVGRTAHAVEEARTAVLDGADYLGVGPCFPSPTKTFTAFAPGDFLAAVAAEIALPTFAIGGITLERLDDVLGRGIGRVAVASAITAAHDPAAAAAAFIARLAARQPAEP
ncbi:MAG: thiamine phosphate synthase [Planctomycetia bacterium]|nr:thiamine phosphate synthase [Planctomycetia bacterium]